MMKKENEKVSLNEAKQFCTNFYRRTKKFIIPSKLEKWKLKIKGCSHFYNHTQNIKKTAFFMQKLYKNDEISFDSLKKMLLEDKKNMMVILCDLIYYLDDENGEKFVKYCMSNCPMSKEKMELLYEYVVWKYEDENENA